MTERSDKWKYTSRLYDIVWELELRGNLDYIGISGLKEKSWKELCDDGIKMFEELKEIDIYGAVSKEEWERYNEEVRNRVISNH